MEFEEVLKLLQSKEEPLKEKGAAELYKILYQPLMRFYRQRRLNKFEAEEVIMTSLLKICTKIDTVKESKKFRAWCWQVARNSLLDHFRKHEKYKNDVTEERLEDIEIVIRMTEEKEKKGNIDECIQLGIQEFTKAMPERGFLMQMKMENLTNEQISLRIGRTLSATKEFVSQSYKKLKPFIKHCKEGNN